jgi:hypothetical protein
MTITEFLEDRYDEDEAAARAASVGPWLWVGDIDQDEGSLYAADGDMVLSAHGMHTEGFLAVDEGDAAHITLHDPARVLADIAAKRAIMENMAGVKMEQPAIRIYREGLAEVTLRMLAHPYAEHPDFDPAWRVA